MENVIRIVTVRMGDVGFLNTVNDDGYGDLTSDYSASSSALSSVSQSSISSNAVSRFCGFATRGLRKLSFLGNAVLLSAMFSHFVKNAYAEVFNDLDWVELKPEVCRMMFLNSVIQHLNNNPGFTEQGYFPIIDVRSELMSLGDGFDSMESLLRYVNTEVSSLDIFIELLAKEADIRGQLSRRLESSGIDIVNALPSGIIYNPLSGLTYDPLADMGGYCTNLDEFFYNELNLTLSTTTTLPITATTELTASSSTEVPSTKTIIMISMASLLMFAFVSFLVGAACSRFKKRSSAKSVCGRSSREENERRNSFELVERRASLSAQLGAAKHDEEVIMMVFEVDEAGDL